MPKEQGMGQVGLHDAARAFALCGVALWLAGCNARGDTPPKAAPPPAEVTVMRAQPRAVTLTE